MTIDELIAALESAEGPSRELDSEIVAACGGVRNPKVAGYGREPGDDDDGYYTLPKYTSSIDAAVALIERALPDAQWHCSSSRTGAKPEGVVHSPWQATKLVSVGYGATPAISLCIALLRAVKEKEG